MGVEETNTYADIPIYVRGNVHAPSSVVARGYLSIAAVQNPPALPKNESGRRQLAAWLTAPDHPLTARVMVNRLWHWVFGQGLCRTVDNIGTTGEQPSHPYLIDHLASQFIHQRWSMKTMIKMMVLSHTFRQKSLPPPYSSDPDNRLLSRANRRSLAAEELRDAMVMTSGELVASSGGRTWPSSRKADYGYVSDALTRSIYLPLFRNALPDIFTAFDGPNTSMVNGVRDVSYVAPQALFMMNNPFVMERATAMAKRVLNEQYDSDQARLQAVYKTLIARPPTAAETTVAMRYLDDDSHTVPAQTSRQAAWAMVIQALFASPAFRLID